MQEKIEALLVKRTALLELDTDDPVVDAMAREVTRLLSENESKLSVEFILESLTKLGGAPSLLYDDNAHWTVGGDGMQNLISDEDRSKETEFGGTWFVKPNRWRKTIREAIHDYLQEQAE